MSSQLDSPRRAFDALIDELGLETGDRGDELQEVEDLLAAPGFDEADLVDLEALPFVTIDNADSRDLDQALYIETTDEGYRVDYALADAAWFMRPGSALWERSMRRGATFYFPHKAVPMMPPALSEGIVSLNPDVVRRAVVLRTRLDAAGHVVDTTVFRARVRSRAKLSYTEVSRWVEDDTLDPQAPWAASLRALREVGERRMRLAMSRGVVPYNRDEATIALSADGRRCEIGVRSRDAAQAWNEQISLLCNTEGAKLMADKDHLARVQSVYRVHAPPVERRLRELRETIDAVIEARGLAEVWRWDGRPESLADYVAGLPGEPPFDRLQLAIERQILHTNRASEFADEAGPHWALAVDPYVRLSSPMREMVGVFTHKELAEAYRWTTPQDDEADRLTRERVIEAANRSRRIQKEIDKRAKLLALDALFSSDLDRELADRPHRTGTIVGIRTTRLYLLLDEVPMDVKVYVDDLEDRYGTTYRREEAALVPASDAAPVLRLGDELSFVVESWDKERRRFVLDVQRV
jgi:ribonuclease R